jgi:hypothetical protein
MNASSRLQLAQRHVSRGREIVTKQREIIIGIRKVGGDATLAEDLLSRFEQSLAIFENDLAVLERNSRLS